MGLAAGSDCTAVGSVFSLSSAGLSSKAPLVSSLSGGVFSGAGEGSGPAGPCGADKIKDEFQEWMSFTEMDEMKDRLIEGWVNGCTTENYLWFCSLGRITTLSILLLLRRPRG